MPTPRKTDDERADGRMLRRFKAEERAIDKMDRQFEAADEMIGELCRNGQPVFYVYPAGGKYREGTRFELTQFLIRNRYV